MEVLEHVIAAFEGLGLEGQCFPSVLLWWVCKGRCKL